MKKTGNWVIIVLIVLGILCLFSVYSAIYDDGYDDGYEKGLEEGYSPAYKDGYYDGGFDGYSEGYNDAESDLAIENLPYTEVFDYLWGAIGLEEISYYIADYSGMTVVLFEDSASDIDRAFFGSFSSRPVLDESSSSIRSQNYAIILDAFESYLAEHNLTSDLNYQLYPLDPDHVYWSSSGLCFHSSTSCPALINVPVPFSGSLVDAYAAGKRAPCGKCVG